MDQTVNSVITGSPGVGIDSGLGKHMAAVSTRNLDDDVKERLRVRAASHGRSMEAEIRAILVEAVTEPDDQPGMLVTLMQRFADLGGVELDLPSRATSVRAADLPE